MAVDEVLARRLVKEFDALAKVDPVAMGKLCAGRAPCGAAYAEHPSVQVASEPHPLRGEDPDASGFRVGMVGMLNGVCGSYDEGPRKGWGAIASVVETETGEVHGFIYLENKEPITSMETLP